MKIVIIIAVLAAVFFLYQRGMPKESVSNNENLQAGAAFLKANSQEDGVVTTASGLQHLQLKTGSGTAHPNATDRVTVHYHGTLIDGTVFDSSVERNEPATFGLNQVIPGWTEGVQLMVVGEKIRFFIPSSLAYGNRNSGPIKAGSTLIFDVELLAIN
jgi:peptidylprolyl isomerase